MRWASIAAWRSSAARVRLVRVFLQVFGSAWLVLEPLALWRPEALSWGVQGYVGLVAGSALVATALSWPKTGITRRLVVSDTRITIGNGDVLAGEGNIVVGVSDVFDTELGDVISPRSVQGQFQSRFFPDHAQLDQQLDQALDGVKAEQDPTKTRGKNMRYSIGTVALVKHGERRFFLSAYSRMGANLQAHSDICKLSTSLEACWKAIRASGQHAPVHMPVIGSRFSRTGLPRHLLIQFIVLSFLDEERKSSITNHLHVHVADGDMDDVDFVVLENWLADLTRAL